MRRNEFPLLAVLLLPLLAGGAAFGATVIVSDNYNVSTTTTGFTLDNGVNSDHIFVRKIEVPDRLKASSVPGLKVIPQALVAIQHSENVTCAA